MTAQTSDLYSLGLVPSPLAMPVRVKDLTVPTSVDHPPVRDGTGGARQVEPARPVPRDLLLRLGASLRKSFIEDGVDEVLERILGWGAATLSPEEIRNLVRSLHACLWPLVTDALHEAKGRPDDFLRQLVGAASRLDAQGAATKFVPTESYARLLASLVSDLLDLVSDPEDREPK